MGLWSGRSVLFATSCAALACGEPPPPAPSAVIRACPSSVCVGDDFLTTIHLDATRSAPRLTLVEAPPDPDEPPLELKWSLSGKEWKDWKFDLGGAKDPDMAISMAGTRPLQVTLRVENAAGGVAEALKTISITALDAAGECSLPDPTANGCNDETVFCQPGQRCVNGRCQEDSEDCGAIGVVTQ